MLELDGGGSYWLKVSVVLVDVVSVVVGDEVVFMLVLVVVELEFVVFMDLLVVLVDYLVVCVVWDDIILLV